MIKTVYLENFKCYGSEGSHFNLAPLTFIYGDNSSGKSTILQAVTYLKQSFLATDAAYDDLRKQFRSLVFKNDISSEIGIGVALETESGLVKVYRKISCISEESQGLDLRYREPRTNVVDTYDPTNASLGKVKEALKRTKHNEALRPRNTKYSASSIADSVAETDLDTDALNSMFRKVGADYLYVGPETLRDTVLGIEVYDKHVGAGIDALKQILIAIHSLGEQGVLLIEEPEAHLHPKYLGAFAQLLVESVIGKPKSQIIVECHSEHILLKLRNLVRNGTITPDKISIIYVNRDTDGAHTTAIRLDGQGRFDRWPGGFFTERTRLLTEGL